MTRNIRTGLVIAIAWSLFGCGSSGDEGNPAGAAASSGTSGSSGTGTSGSSGTGTSGSSGTGTSGSSGTGTSGSSGAGTSGAGGTGTSGAGGTGTSGASGTGTSGAGGTGTPIVDGGRVTFGSTQCTDGKDNDGDGLIDAQDPECTGPLDNDEGSYATGIPGDNKDACQDCFFDGDSGQGNDGCAYPSSCFDGVDPGGAADCFNCAVSTRCVDFCKPYTPNGCDCFGCCEVHGAGGVTKTVRLSATCTAADINDATKCQTCTQSTTCVNKCDTCELCLGKTTLPASCTPTGAGGAGAGGANAGGASNGGANAGGASNGGANAGGAPSTGGANTCPTPSCPSGVSPCGVSCLPNCPAGEYCLTGCCVRSPA